MRKTLRRRIVFDRKRIPTPLDSIHIGPHAGIRASTNPRTWVRQEDVNCGGTARPCPTSNSAKTIPSKPPRAMRVCRPCHWQTCNFFQTSVIISRTHRRAGTMGEIAFREVSGCNGHLPLYTYKFEILHAFDISIRRGCLDK